MSYALEVPLPLRTRVPVHGILLGLRPASVAFAEEVDLRGDWPEGYRHLYVNGESARGVEISRDEGGFEVRLMACSNRVDLELGLALVYAFAARGSGKVQPEDGEEMPIEELASWCDEQWLEHQLASGPRVFATLVEERQEVMTVPAAVRDYHLGPRHLARLRKRAAGGPIEPVILDDIRRVQFPEEDDLFLASVMSVQKEGPEPYTAAVVGAEVRYLLPKVDRYILHSDDGSLTEIPWERLSECLEVEFVDERQVLAGPVAPADWPEVLAVARRGEHRELDRGGQQAEEEAPPSKPWWKFW